MRGDESSARPLSEIYCGVTLEWLADSCSYIGIYTAETVKPDFSGHKALWDGENRVFLIVPDDLLPHTKKQEKKRTE